MRDCLDRMLTRSRRARCLHRRRTRRRQNAPGARAAWPRRDERGCICLTGHCYEMEGVAALHAVRGNRRADGAHGAAGRARGDGRIRGPGDRGDGAEPASRRISDIPPPPDVPARAAAAADLRRVPRVSCGAESQKSPGVFLLDDLHWADEPTLQLLLHVAPHIASDAATRWSARIATSSST